VQVAGAERPESKKARGAFFTPGPIAQYIGEWAIRDSSDRVLEPSCGDAVFLSATADRFKALGSSVPLSHVFTLDQVQGVEIHPPSALCAAQSVASAGLQATILVGNFFTLDPEPTFDAVIGNPPYVRYQSFSGEHRAKAQQRALEAGVRLSGLSSSWAAFTVHATRFLKPGGRLGLVLPAELLTVDYAAAVRSFLMTTFSSVELVLFEERVFPGVNEEVLLVLAEGTGPTDRFTVRQAKGLEDLPTLRSGQESRRVTDTKAKWLPALLADEHVAPYTRLSEGQFGHLALWGTPYLGAVTGNNRFFALSREDVKRCGIDDSDVIAISPPGSRHLRRTSFSPHAWNDLSTDGSRCFLFYPGDAPGDSALDYIDRGEYEGVHLAFKCRSRDPWWRVPLVPVPDLFLTYMNHDAPRLVLNSARVRHLNSVHGFRLRHGLKQLGRDYLPIAFLNSMTLLGAELVGRSYGGGVLKVELREAARLPVPSPELVRRVATELRHIASQLAVDLRGDHFDRAVDMVDEALLVGGAELPRGQTQALQAARATLFGRRAARS
jgi:adenine-specific DNA methylase